MSEWEWFQATADTLEWFARAAVLGFVVIAFALLRIAAALRRIADRLNGGES